MVRRAITRRGVPAVGAPPPPNPGAASRQERCWGLRPQTPAGAPPQTPLGLRPKPRSRRGLEAEPPATILLRSRPGVWGGAPSATGPPPLLATALTCISYFRSLLHRTVHDHRCWDLHVHFCHQSGETGTLQLASPEMDGQGLHRDSPSVSRDETQLWKIESLETIAIRDCPKRLRRKCKHLRKETCKVRATHLFGRPIMCLPKTHRHAAGD